MKAYHGAQNGSDEAHEFDKFLLKLETTKQQPSPRRWNRADSSDNSTFDSRNESAFGETIAELGLGRTSAESDFETRQRFVDREGPTTSQGSVDSFIERAQSGTSGSQRGAGGDTWYVEGEGGGLPDAILKLDRRQAIPTPRHKNDVLVEIEASTVDRRDLLVRPGVRCTETLPQGVETVAADCIGRVVQTTTHARAVHGIAIDDRVAAICPFEYKDGKGKGQRNKRYALVDAGLVVTVPRHVDASDAACIVRLYMTAFQSVRLGLGTLHDRYDFNQLRGKSILVQNGLTELGRAIIDLAGLLGAERIFATGPTEQHDALKELGAIPLGLATFSWELFVEERLSVVLVQETPTTENFEQFISILDEKGNMVYIEEGHGDDEADELGLPTDSVNCELLNLGELAKKVQGAVKSAKFDMLLACTPRYLIYEGVWRSAKENQSQFKEDLRYLFTLLGRGGGLKPNVIECVGLEDIAGVQDRIELLGKEGSIVCLPTALYERKVVVSPKSDSNRGQTGFPGAADGDVVTPEDRAVQDYASDAGYSTPAFEALSDFNRMKGATESTGANTDNPATPNLFLPVLPESASFHKVDSEDQFHSPLPPCGGYAPEYDTSSVVSSIGHSSPSNQDAQTTMSDGALRFITPFSESDPPAAIVVRSKQTRRDRAYQRQKRVKERRRSQQAQHKKDRAETNETDGLRSLPSQDKSVSSAGCTSRRLRREARTRAQNDVTTKGKTEGQIVDDRNEAHATKAPVTKASCPTARVKKASYPTSSDEHRAVMKFKMNQRSQAVRRAGNQPKAGSIEHDDTRDDVGAQYRPTTQKSASFNKLMSKWEGMTP